MNGRRIVGVLCHRPPIPRLLWLCYLDLAVAADRRRREIRRGKRPIGYSEGDLVAPAVAMSTAGALGFGSASSSFSDGSVRSPAVAVYTAGDLSIRVIRPLWPQRPFRLLGRRLLFLISHHMLLLWVCDFPVVCFCVLFLSFWIIITCRCTLFYSMRLRPALL